MAKDFEFVKSLKGKKAFNDIQKVVIKDFDDIYWLIIIEIVRFLK